MPRMKPAAAEKADTTGRMFFTTWSFAVLSLICPPDVVFGGHHSIVTLHSYYSQVKVLKILQCGHDFVLAYLHDSLCNKKQEIT